MEVRQETVADAGTVVADADLFGPNEASSPAGSRSKRRVRP